MGEKFSTCSGKKFLLVLERKFLECQSVSSSCDTNTPYRTESINV